MTYFVTCIDIHHLVSGWYAALCCVNLVLELHSRQEVWSGLQLRSMRSFRWYLVPPFNIHLQRWKNMNPCWDLVTCAPGWASLLNLLTRMKQVTFLRKLLLICFYLSCLIDHPTSLESIKSSSNFVSWLCIVLQFPLSFLFSFFLSFFSFFHAIWCFSDSFGSCVWTASTDFVQWLCSSSTNHSHPIL